MFAYFAVSGLLEHLPEVVPAIAVLAPATRPVAAVVFVLFFGMCFYHFHRRARASSLRQREGQ